MPRRGESPGHRLVRTRRLAGAAERTVVARRPKAAAASRKRDDGTRA
jgi:hypothetical protein